MCESYILQLRVTSEGIVWRDIAQCMSTRRDSLDLEGLSAQLRNLTINITVVNDSRASPIAPVATASTDSAPLASGSSGVPFSRTPSHEDSQGSGLTWAHRSTSTTCPASVLRLAASLRGAGEDRIRVAYLRGREAAAIARGEQEGFRSDSQGGRRVCYVVLLCEETPEPFITFSRAAYFRAVHTGPGGSCNPDSISHGFASRAEAQAFCLGAGLGGLPRRRD